MIELINKTYSLLDKENSNFPFPLARKVRSTREPAASETAGASLRRKIGRAKLSNCSPAVFAHGSWTECRVWLRMLGCLDTFLFF